MKELDAKIAEKVFGLRVSWYLSAVDGASAYPVLASDGERVPAYTSNVATDYEVLRHVRETWIEKPIFAEFVAHLRLMQEDRVPDTWGLAASQSFYEPGDYSRAALKALGE